METMKAIKEWWHNVQTESKVKRQRKAMRALVKESSEILQAMEFKGEIYLCYHGVPLLTEDSLTSTLADTLEESRGIYVEYMNAKEV